MYWFSVLLSKLVLSSTTTYQVYASNGSAFVLISASSKVLAALDNTVSIIKTFTHAVTFHQYGYCLPMLQWGRSQAWWWTSLKMDTTKLWRDHYYEVYCVLSDGVPFSPPHRNWSCTAWKTRFVTLIIRTMQVTVPYMKLVQKGGSRLLNIFLNMVLTSTAVPRMEPG